MLCARILVWGMEVVPQHSKAWPYRDFILKYDYMWITLYDRHTICYNVEKMN
jgi:hypothetical protein